MNLRLVQFSLGPNTRPAAEAIAGKLIPQIRTQPGCDRCEFFGDDETGDYGIIVLWESPEAANDAAGVIAPQLGAALEGANATSMSRRLFEIYDA